MEQFDRFYATFQPQRTDDLKPGAQNFIGRRFLWEAGWIIDDGAYAGDWHCYLLPDEQGNWPVPAGVFVWTPLCDLADIEMAEARA